MVFPNRQHSTKYYKRYIDLTRKQVQKVTEFTETMLTLTGLTIKDAA